MSYRKVFTITKKALGCSQPFLNRVKYEQVLKEGGEKGALPVMNYEGRYFLTDGHTRAFLHVGDDIDVYVDEDVLNPLQQVAYGRFISWTQDLGVETVADLAERIISEEDFISNWVDRCANLYNELSQDNETEIA